MTTMLIASASNSQAIASSSSVKLRRSRRLSSTRGLKRTTANHPKNDPSCQDFNQKLGIYSASNKRVDDDNSRSRLPINWEMNERISLSSGSSTGLAIRPDNQKGIEFSENRRREGENRSKIGECSERNRAAKLSSSNKSTLELMNVSGFPSNVDRKHRGCGTSIELDNAADDNILKSDSKYEIDILNRNCATRKQRRQDALREDNVDTTKRRTKNKPGDSISKRLELIHELNQKILANYERFQQRSRHAKDTKEQAVKGRNKNKIDPEEHIYSEIKKKNKTACKTSDRKERSASKQDVSNQNACKKDFLKQSACSSINTNTNKLTFPKNYYNKMSIKEPEEKKDSLGAASKPNRRVVCGNENFSMTAKENLSCQVDEKTQLPVYSKPKDRKERLSEGSSVFYANENILSMEMESTANENCLENSRLYPESYDLGNNELKNDCSKENAKDDATVTDRSDEPEEDARMRSADVAVDEKILENEILEKLDETIDRFDNERVQLTPADSNEEKDSFSTDSIQSCSPSSARGTKDVANLQDTFNSSWDSGVGVDVGNGSGWVRIHTGIESSLVYLTLDTTAKDVCRDMLLGDDLSLFVQVSVNLRG